MINDPRVRLLGPVDDAAAQPVLAALDSVRLQILVGEDVDDQARLAVAATAAIGGRLFGAVEIIGDRPLPANWWGVTSITELVGLVSVNPSAAPTETYILTVGAQVDRVGDVGVGGGDYQVRLGTARQPVDVGQHYLGLHAAGCLAIGHLLSRTLARFGRSVVPIPETYALSLLTHRVGEIPISQYAQAPGRHLDLVLAGGGSVGSSTAALLAMSVPKVGADLTRITVVDDDEFDPDRNPFRYPALTGGERDPKASWLAERLRTAGISATAETTSVGIWGSRRPTPELRGLVVSSVDTLAGRLQVTDLLAEETLSIGVAGLALHVQREHFADDHACPFCDYVSVAPPLTQADVHAGTTGISLARIIELMQPGARLTDADVQQAVAGGKLQTARAVTLVGRRLDDLIRQVYAETSVPVPGGDGVIAIASPHVSWFAGALAAVEVIKQLLGLPLLKGRVDADLGGLPPGLVRQMPADATGQCLCGSAIRRRWYRKMYAA